MQPVSDGAVAPTVAPDSIRVVMASVAVYPSRLNEAFAMASDLGYDGIEVMVWSDKLSQNPTSLRQLAERYDMPVTSIHAPSLVVSQGVWGRLPGPKLERSVDLALDIGADTVVVHPPFRWQGKYASGFADHVNQLNQATPVKVSVENMFPWRWRGRAFNAYLPGWDLCTRDYEHVTLDLSHAAVAQQNGLQLLRQLQGRVQHIHLADGSYTPADQHLVPGRGTQPCGEVLQELARTDWSGDVVVEIQTRRAPSAKHVRADLADSLSFARAHLRAGAQARLNDTTREPAAIG